jgi:hypothetical protein
LPKFETTSVWPPIAALLNNRNDDVQALAVHAAALI